MTVPKIFSAITAAALMLMTSSAGAEPIALAFEEGVDWSGKVITVKGEGVAPREIVNQTHASGMAFQAAKSDAYRKFGEVIGGVHVEGDKTVSALAVTQTIRTRVEATINGAKVVGQDLFDERNGNCAVYMQVPIFGATNSLAGAVLEKFSTLEPFPKPEADDNLSTAKSPLERVSDSPLTIKTLASEPLNRKTGTSPARTTKKSVKDFADKAQGNYTGLIVDCRGLNLKPVMSPVILNTNGTKIYGHKNLDFDRIISEGMADYISGDGGGNLNRAGNNPLVVKAVKLENFDSCPVITIADSNRVLIENHATKFLKDLKVVFLMD